MKVLQVHSFYQHRGGEESVLDAEAHLLRRAGVVVDRFVTDNRDIAPHDRIRTARNTVWARDVEQELGRVISRTAPDLLHVHNTFPRLSPAVYVAARKHAVPVVQTLHNYRLVCPEAMLLRDGKACLDCVGKSVPYPGVVHGCYRNSRAQTAVIATMLSVHRARGTFGKDVSRYIALTEFARGIFVAGGLPPERIVVKPNFLESDPEPGHGPGEYLLFAGRLSHEKGIETLIRAWDDDSAPPLQIVGDGPMAAEVAALAARNPRVQYLGRRGRGEVFALMRDAAALVMPSLYFEGLPMTVVESFASATAVICADHGSLAEIVDDGVTGWRVPPGDPRALRETAETVWSSPNERERRGRAARAVYLRRYTAQQNLQQLMDVYAGATGFARSGQPSCHLEHAGTS